MQFQIGIGLADQIALTFAILRNASSILDCQPGPLALKCEITSGLNLIETGILVGALWGPRFGKRRASSPGFKSFNFMPLGNFVALAKSASVHSGLSSSNTGSLALRGIASHFLCMCASKADRPVSLIANGENQAISSAVDITVSAISRFAVIEAIVRDDSEIVKINPTRERYAMFLKVFRFFGRVEIRHYRIYDLL
jgi:hypothetical protein